MTKSEDEQVETDARWTNHLDDLSSGVDASARIVETDARWTNHLDLEGALERVEMSEWKPMRGGPITSTRCSAREGRYFFQVETDARWTNHLD